MKYVFKCSSNTGHAQTKSERIREKRLLGYVVKMHSQRNPFSL
jgi:hypothetical protein